MRIQSLLVAALAAAGLQQAAIAQSRIPQYGPPPGYQTSLCVTTAIGACGNICEPFDCEPNYTLVSSYETMLFDIAGAPNSHYVLFFGVAVPGCLTVPNIAGQLAVWTPAAPITMGWLPVEDVNIEYDCEPVKITYRQYIPAVPAGVDIRFQVLGLNVVANHSGLNTGSGPQLQLAFSRATEARTR